MLPCASHPLTDTMTGRFIKPRDCLADTPGLAALLPAARRLRSLEDRLMDGLAGCRLARVEGETLWIECPNGARAARLRSQSASLLALARREGLAVTTCKVRVRADSEYAAPPRRPDLGTRGIGAFTKLDRDLEDGSLRDAVRALLRHARQRSGQG